MLNFETVIDNTPAVNTAGYFKDLMESISAYVKAEYSAGRLTGTEYANVYLTAMQAALQQSVQFALQKDLQDAQVALITAQRDNELLQGTVLTAEKQLKDQQKLNLIAEAYNIPKQGTLLDRQALDLSEATTLKTAQKGLVNNQAASELIQATVLTAQKDLYNAQKQGFSDKTLIDKAKIRADVYAVQIGVNGVVGANDGINPANIFTG